MFRAKISMLLIAVVSSSPPILKDATYQSSGKLLEVNVQRSLNSSSSRDNASTLQRTLDHAQGIVQRALHLVQHEIVSSTKNDRGG